MKKSTLIKFACVMGIFAGSAARGQVFNVHNIDQGYAFYNGYNVMAYGQGVCSDPGNNIWNGFGNGGPIGVGDSFGGGLPNDPLVPGNPGNPYAWARDGIFAHGPNLFSPTSPSLAGNATSAGVHSPVTMPSVIFGFDSGKALASGTLRTNVAEWILSWASVVNAASPGIGTSNNPLGSLTLSNVPAGTYDLYLYGANADGTRGATFFSSSGTPSNGVSTTMNTNAAAGSGPLTNFVFGGDYVVFNNVSPAADSTIHVTWGAISNINSTLTGEGDFNGLQLAKSVPIPAGAFINEEPVNSIYSQGTTATLSVVGSGDPAVGIQWFSGSPPGTAVVGQNSNTLTFANAQASQSGNYFAVVTNVSGAVTSSVATLTIAASPIITAQSTSASTNSLLLYSGHNQFGFSMTTYGNAPLYYYWETNGVPAAITTNVSSKSFNNVTASATYMCIVSNSFGTATNNPLQVTTIAAPTSPYATALLALQPYAYWSLTETSGTIAYDYTSGNNGYYVGGVTSGSPGPTAGFGTPSYAYALDGTTAYVDVPGAPLNFTGPLTLVTWSFGGDISKFETFAGKGNTSYRSDLDQNGVAHFNDDSGNEAVGGPKLEFAGWHQIVGTYDGAEIKLYVDGALAAQGSDTPSVRGSALDFWIGGAPDYGAGRLFTGSIGQVAIFTNALTGSNVAALFAAAETPPFISVEPTNNFTGYVGGTMNVNVAATGALPLGYQWSGPGGAIPGATNTTLIVTNLNQTGVPTNSGPGAYFCTITNTYGSTNSGNVNLTVISSGPVFLQDLPLINYALIGGTAILSVQVGGNEPITNQWYYGATAPPTTALHDGDRGGRVSGTTNQTLLIAAATTNDEGYYQILVTNGIAPFSASSQVGQLVVELEPLFNGDGSGWTFNGGAVMNSPNVLTLTDGGTGEARSFFFNTPVYIGAFEASFTYQSAPGSAPLADGVTFCLQNSAAGPTALGGAGGALGYGDPGGIRNSAAIAIDMFNAHGVGYFTGGEAPNNNTSQYISTTPEVDPASTHPINVSIVYNGNTLALSLLDTVTNGMFATNLTVGSIPSVVGGTTAYIGFTAGTGADTSIQTITNFTFTPLPTLSASRSGTNVVISWPTGIGGYQLQSSPSLKAPVWTTLPGPYPIVGQQYQVVVTSPTGAQFYRLLLP